MVPAREGGRGVFSGLTTVLVLLGTRDDAVIVVGAFETRDGVVEEGVGLIGFTVVASL